MCFKDHCWSSRSKFMLNKSWITQVFPEIQSYIRKKTFLSTNIFISESPNINLSLQLHSIDLKMVALLKQSEVCGEIHQVLISEKWCNTPQIIFAILLYLLYKHHSFYICHINSTKFLKVISNDNRHI